MKLWAMTIDSNASQAMNGLYRIPRYEAKTIIRCPNTIQSFCGAAAKALDGNWHLSALTYSEWGNDSLRAFIWSWRLPYRCKCEIASLNAQTDLCLTYQKYSLMAGFSSNQIIIPGARLRGIEGKYQISNPPIIIFSKLPRLNISLTRQSYH